MNTRTTPTKSGEQTGTRSQQAVFRALACFLLLLLAGGTAVAQKAVSGRVTDAADNTGLPGVSVSVKGTTTGTVTDANGGYRFNITDENSTLVFSFVGYVSQEVALAGRSTVDVALAADVQALQEVVVVGYGVQRKADVTGATATVTARDFNSGVINNPLQAVAGRVAGLVVTAPNGDPNQNSPVIRLRGTSSLAANSEPLIVIDGIVGAPLNSVAPEDIEKYDVLKDASAAAIYGSRGANGVIIITTKRGKAGKTTVEYNGYVGVESVAKSLDFLSADEFRSRARERNLTPLDLGANTDWFREITRTALSHNNGVSVSGGTDKFSYRGSLTYLNQPGIAINSGFDRLNARLNLTQKALNDKLELQLNLSTNTSNRQFVNYEAFRAASRMLPTSPVYNANGTFYQPTGFEVENPVARATQLLDEARDKQFLGNFKVFYEVVKGLRVGVNASLSNFNQIGGRFTPNTYLGLGNTLSRGERYTREVTDRLAEYTASYNTTFGQSNLGFLIGYTLQRLSNEGFDASNRDFLTDAVSYNRLQDGQLASSGQFLGAVNSNRSEALLDGLIARANYSYADKYLVTANFRRDGSSRFGSNNRYGYFPSLSVGWRLSQEEFLKSVPFISDLKLRAGYGVTGNQDGIADYGSRQLYERSSTYFFNGTYRAAYRFSQNANPNLKWETSAMTNVGVDFGFLNNRLTGSVEFYNKDTRDVLFNYPVAIGSVIGGTDILFNELLANVGQINNRGIEFAAEYLAVDKRDFQWRTTLNLAHNRNRVVKLSNDQLEFPEDGIPYGGFGTGQGGLQQPSILQEGRPIGQFFGAKFLGYNDKGEFTYQGRDNSVVTDAAQAERTFIGDAQPRLTMGWANTFLYKNFDLSFFFRGSFGQKIANGPYIVFANPTNFPTTNVVRDAFTEYGQVTAPAQFSSLYVEDGSFVRLDNFNLGYKIPLKGTAVSNLRVYLSGQNLFVLTKYRGIDPELRNGAPRDVYGVIDEAARRQNLSPGVNEINFYPRTRSFVAGVSLTF